MLIRHTNNNVSTAPAPKGFTLVEVLVGVSILVLAALSLFALFDFTLKVLWENKARAGAQALANQKVEIARNLPFDDIGTVGGIPNGVLTQVEQVMRNNIQYTVTTTVIYIDDPFDGTLGGVPEDLLPTDYKRVRIEVAWPFRLSSHPLVFLSDVAPQGIETANGGGTLRINVLDAQGLPVPQANVHIENTDIVPAVDLDIITGDNGQVLLPGAAASVEGYDVVVTKSGYSTDQTYEVVPVTLPTPIKPPLTVVGGIVTDSTFAIDQLSTMNVFAFADTVYVPSWWDENYTKRRRLTVTNNSADTSLPVDYSISFDFDHYDQVQQGDALASGDDVRVLWYNGASWEELDRVNSTNWNTAATSTKLWFKNKQAITSSGTDDNYFLYYGNSGASTPPSNANNVYSFYDDFSDPVFTYANWATTTDTWAVNAGEYHQTSAAVETHAHAGSTDTNYLLQADVRAQTIGNDAGLVGRKVDDFNYYVGRPSDLPTTITSADDNVDILSKRTLVEATDGTLALFTVGTSGNTYHMYTSADNGITWVDSWQLPISSTPSGHGAWIDPATDTIYFTYSAYVAGSDDYQVRFVAFTYSGGTWTAGTSYAVAAHSFAERPYNPHVIMDSGTVFVTYARYQPSNQNEIALRTSVDAGATWSSESWLTNWTTSFNNLEEREALRGFLLQYSGQVTTMLNGAQSAGWRQYNGSTWTAYTSFLTSTFHNEAFAPIVDGTNLDVMYRHAGDSGYPHRQRYNGSTWSDSTIASMSTGYAYSVFLTDNREVVMFPSDAGSSSQLYMTGFSGTDWTHSIPVYTNTTPVDEIVSTPTTAQNGFVFAVFVAGGSGGRVVYSLPIGLEDAASSITPIVTEMISGSPTLTTPAVSQFATMQNYTLRMILEDSLIKVFTNDTLTFGDVNTTFASGYGGLYANSTEAYFDNVIFRKYLSPEPTTSGQLEEDLSSSQPLADVTFTLRGSKLIGYDSGGLPVYKYLQVHTTDGTGRVDVANVEWDSYDVIVDDVVEGYDLKAVDPPDAIALLPNTTQQVNLFFKGDETYSSRIKVLDVDGDPIENASVLFEHAASSYSELETTPSYGQSFFSPLTEVTYDLTVTKTGFDDNLSTVVVDEDEVVTVTLIEEGGSPPPPTAPDAPTITGFSSIAQTSMLISWLDNADNEDEYRVYRNTTNSKPGTPLVTLAANSTNYPASGLTCGTTYYWWIEAYNATGTADDTDSQATSNCLTPPAAPTNLVFSNIDEDAMDLGWTDNATDEDGYRIYRDLTSTKPGTPLTTLSADASSYPATGLTCNTTYHWWVEAYNAAGSSDVTDSQATNACAPTQVFFDTFTESSNTILDSHTPDVGTGWTQIIEVINSGTSRLRVRANVDQLRRNTCYTSEGALYEADDVISSADYEVRVRQVNGDIGDDPSILAARIQDPNNMYVLRWNESAAYLHKRVGGVWTTIAGPAGGISDGSTVILKVDGTTISAIDDSNTILSVTDSSHSAAGKAGVGMGAVVVSGDDCSSQRLDDFEVYTN